MTGFINHLISRHSNPANSISPRLPGRFETNSAYENMVQENNFNHQGPKINDDRNVIEHHIEQAEHTRKTLDTELSSVQGVNKADKTTETKGKFRAKDENASENVMYSAPVSVRRDVNDNVPGKALEVAGSRAGSPVNIDRHDNSISPNGLIEKNEKFSPEINAKHLSQETNVPTYSNLVEPSFVKQQAVDITSLNNLRDGTQSSSSRIIKVSIGRIEVRAVQQPDVTRKGQSSAPKPKLSLEEYLRKRNNNGQ